MFVQFVDDSFPKGQRMEMIMWVVLLMSSMEHVLQVCSLQSFFLLFHVLIALHSLVLLIASYIFVPLRRAFLFDVVIWGFISNEVAQAADEDLAAVKAKLSSDQTKRWQAIGMLRNIFSCVNLPWELKKQAINFLLSIVDGNVSRQYDNEHMEWSSDMPSIFATLQVVSCHLFACPTSMFNCSLNS